MSICIYCCRNRTVTVEHIIPSALYKEFRTGKNLSKEFYLKAPACEQCNNIKSKNDEIFRNLMVASNADKHIEADKLIPILGRSISKNQTFLKMFSDDNLDLVENNDTGEMRLKFKDIDFDFRSYLRLITRGLFWVIMKEVIPMDIEIRILQVDPLDNLSFRLSIDFLNKKGFVIPEDRQDPIFSYAYRYNDERKAYEFIISYFDYGNFIVVFKFPR